MTAQTPKIIATASEPDHIAPTTPDHMPGELLDSGVIWRLRQPFDAGSTSDAATLIATHRIANAGLIPHAAWTILAHAEDRLNKELKQYFHGERE